jgi:hypothetical protein
MLDIFTKSKVELASGAPLPQFDQPPDLNSAWRIVHAIDDALKAAETERKALIGCVEDATAWAAVSLGNGNDEYLERESLDTIHLNRFDAQIRDGHTYMVRLDQNIAYYRLLRSTLLAGFPELSRKQPPSAG